MDKYRIDSHKLIYHVNRVSDWLKGKNIYPIYAEISPSGRCNHNCSFCAYDYVEQNQIFINTDILKERLSEMGSLGVKSVLYSGEGEPLLHKDIAEIINHTKKAGIDVALASNGVLMKKQVADSIIENLTWMKISINAGARESYANIHGTKPDDFDNVIDNLSYAVEVKKRKGYQCTIGMQILLLPENWHEVEPLAKIARDIGVDYLVVKPYSQHLFSKTTKYKNVKYENYLHLADKLKKYDDNDFNVIFRISTMRKWDENSRNYRHCLALPFWAHIDTSGNVWACGAYVLDERFRVGNINEKTFKEIWEGKRRVELAEWAIKKLNTTDCRVNCRMDDINRYLWDLIHPSGHVNFI